MVSKVRLTTLLAALLSGTATLHAQAEVTWNGGFPDYQSSTATNWVSGTVPIGNGSETLQFVDNSSGLLQLSTAASFAGIEINTSSTDQPFFTIDGSQVLTLGNGGISINGPSGGSESLTINTPVTITGSQAWAVYSGDDGSLSVNGAITGSFALVLYGNSIPASFSLGSSASTFSGGVHLEGSSSTLFVGASSTGPAGGPTSGPLGTGALLMDDNTGLTAGGPGGVILANAVTFGSRGSVDGAYSYIYLGNTFSPVEPETKLTLSGPITLNDADLELSLGQNTLVTFTGPLNGFTTGVCLNVGSATDGANSIADVQAGFFNVARLDLEDRASLILDATSPGSGTAQVGTLEDIGVQSPQAYLGIGSGYAATGGYTAALISWLSTTSSGNIQGTLGFDTTSGTAATFNDPVDLTNFTNENFVGLGSASKAVLGSTAVITPPGGASGSLYPFGGGGGTLTVDSALPDGSGARSLSLSAGGAPLTLVLSGALTYTGGTNVAGGALIFNTPLPSTGLLSLGSGSSEPGYIGSTAASGYTDGNSNIQAFVDAAGQGTPNGVIGFDNVGGPRSIMSSIDMSAVGTGAFLGSATSVDFTSAGTITPNSGTYRFAGVKGGIVQVDSVLSGAGDSVVVGLPNPMEAYNFSSGFYSNSTVVLTGANTYGGTTTLNSGNLEVTNSSSLGTSTLVVPEPAETPPSGWAANLSPHLGPVTLANNIEVSDAGLSLNPGGGNMLTLTGNITPYSSEQGSLGIFGPVTLSGANTYSGGTVIHGSSTIVVNVSSNSGLGTGSVQASNTTLSFTGPAPVLASASGASTFFNQATVSFSGNPIIDSLNVLQSTIAFNGSTALINGISDDGTANSNVIALGAGTALTIDTVSPSDGGNGAGFGGTIAGGSTSSLTLEGGGEVDLRGANTYGGGTTIAPNTAVIVSNNSALGTGNVNVAATGIVVTNTGIVLTNPITLAIGSSGNPGGVLAGYGTYSPGGTLTLASGQAVDPGRGLFSTGSGNSSLIPVAGTLSFGSGTSLTLGPAGLFVFSLVDAAGAAGVGYGTVSMTSGTLSITANASSPFNIFVTTFDPATGMPGNAANFNAANSYAWTLISAGSIPTFSSTNFNVITSNFLNTNSGTFSVSESGNDLILNFTPVPEPAAWALLAFGVFALGVGGAVARRRRR